MLDTQHERGFRSGDKRSCHLSAHSKKAWLGFGLCLTAAGTAYAAIPDANGVVHGCYNVLTGSARIIDGNSCGLLEKAVTWQQTGPRGPAGAPGPQGPQGPQGPAGTSNIVVGHAFFDLNSPVAPKQTSLGYASNGSVTAPSDGNCSVTISGTMLEAPGQLFFQPAIRDNNIDQGTLHSQIGVLAVVDDPSSGSDIKQIAGGTVMDTFGVSAGHNYNFGAQLEAVYPIAIAKPVTFSISWVCEFES